MEYRQHINKYNRCPIEFRLTQQEKFRQIKYPLASTNLNEFKKLSRNTILKLGGLMLSGAEKRKISIRDRKVEVKYFSGAASDGGHFWGPSLVGVALEVSVVGGFYYMYIFY